MAAIMFDNLNDREFLRPLGRLRLILICGALAVVTLEPETRGIPLYLDKEGNSDNMVNSMLWNMLMGAPLIAILRCGSGYLATSQVPAGTSGNIRGDLVPITGDVSRHPPLDANSAPLPCV